MATSDAPVSIGRVTLTVRDTDAMARFYESALGLNLVRRDGDTVVLGQADRPLVELRQDRLARSRPHEAGLFHTAFLLPDRESLARWLVHARQHDVRLDGASDHLVSEALYLTDPEGNGIEIYRDRPREEWPRRDGRIELVTLPLDLAALASSATAAWEGAPDGTVIGHVHLQVGDVAEHEDFVVSHLGLQVTSRVPSAGFYGSGGYHHHLGGNVWNSRGAGARSPGTTGLAEVELLADPDVLTAGSATDPWGTRFTIVPVHRARAAKGAELAA